jgi:hypothetical protein
MKSLLIIAAYLSAVAFLQAQPFTVEIEVTNTAEPSVIILSNPYAIMCGNGVVVLNEYTKEKSMLQYFLNNRMVWKSEADKEYSEKSMIESYNLTGYDKRRNFMVASNSGSWVYNVEMKPDDINKKDQYITQVSADGKTRKFTIEGRPALGNALQTVFCDDQYFYYLTTENGDEMSAKKKVSEKLILNRFDARDFSYKRFELKLPPVEPSDYASFWSFIGQTETEKLLVSKKIDLDADRIRFTIGAFDGEGKITRIFQIEPQLDNKFIRPSTHIKSPVTNYHQQAEFDYSPKKMPGAYYATVNAHEVSFGTITFDPNTQRFFVLGLTGPKPFTKVGAVQDGFYVMRFDLKGSLDWKLQALAPKTLMSEGAFRVHATPGYRYIYLKNNVDGSLQFYIQVKKIRFGWPISEDGKLGKQVVVNSLNVADSYVFTLSK